MTTWVARVTTAAIEAVSDRGSMNGNLDDALNVVFWTSRLKCG